jgi:hypothetical protein
MVGLWIIIITLLAVIAGLTLRCRRVVAEQSRSMVDRKNRGLVRQIRERERLEKTIERILYDKHILNHKLKCKK